jgi:hypothetical protein
MSREIQALVEENGRRLDAEMRSVLVTKASDEPNCGHVAQIAEIRTTFILLGTRYREGVQDAPVGICDVHASLILHLTAMIGKLRNGIEALGNKPKQTED